MKKRLSRLLPDSLLGQLILLTLLGIVAMTGINFFALCVIQHGYKNQAEKTRAENVVSQYLLLDGLEREARHGAVKSVARPGRVPESGSNPGPQTGPQSGLALELLPAAPDWVSGTSYYERNALRLLRQSLGENGVPPDTDVHARIPANGPGGPWLQTAVRLSDGSWMAVTQPLSVDDARAVWTQRLMVLLELLVFSGIIIALLMRVTRPLRRMSLAAEAFGRHPEGECPLPEDGSREVREAAQSFNRMRERILGTLAERRRMLAAMGHDLRTPLARAKLRLEEIEPEALREKFAGNLADIQSIVEQGLELAGSLQTSEEPVMLDLSAFVASLADDAAEEGKPVRLAAPPEESGPLVVRARPLCLKRCLDNLIANAVLYGGGAAIEIVRQADAVVIDILDSGPGIPPGSLEKVFEPYYRLEASRNRASGGAGLGLSIARNMASLSNGRVTLENRPEGGLRARLALSVV